MCEQSRTVENKIKSIILKNAALNYKESDISETSNLIEDFGFDSIEIIQLIIDIENDFDIHIDDDFLIVGLSPYNGVK